MCRAIADLTRASALTLRAAFGCLHSAAALSLRAAFGRLSRSTRFSRPFRAECFPPPDRWFRCALRQAQDLRLRHRLPYPIPPGWFATRC